MLVKSVFKADPVSFIIFLTGNEQPERKQGSQSKPEVVTSKTEEKPTFRSVSDLLITKHTAVCFKPLLPDRAVGREVCDIPVSYVCDH